MMNDLDIKNKRILLFDFDGTLIETASGNTFATDLTDMRIKMALCRQPSQPCTKTVKTRMLFISRIRMKMM